MAQLHAAKSQQPTYVYRYAFRGSFSLSDFITHNKTDYGVSHADDIMRIFKYPGIELNTPEDRAMSEVLINIIYSYSTTGTPKLSDVGSVWHPLKPETPELDYLEILSPNKSEMKYSADFGQKSFWDKLGLNENENYREFVKDEL